LPHSISAVAASSSSPITIRPVTTITSNLSEKRPRNRKQRQIIDGLCSDRRHRTLRPFRPQRQRLPRTSHGTLTESPQKSRRSPVKKAGNDEPMLDSAISAFRSPWCAGPSMAARRRWFFVSRTEHYCPLQAHRLPVRARTAAAAAGRARGAARSRLIQS
jgi:hypothetical protein